MGNFTPIEVSIGPFFGTRTAIANRKSRYRPIEVHKTGDRPPKIGEQGLFAVAYRCWGAQNHSLSVEKNSAKQHKRTVGGDLR